MSAGDIISVYLPSQWSRESMTLMAMGHSCHGPFWQWAVLTWGVLVMGGFGDGPFCPVTTTTVLDSSPKSLILTHRRINMPTYIHTYINKSKIVDELPTFHF
mgnify:CR=1 FL=1